MSTIEEVIQADKEFARTFTHGALPSRPARRLAVVACMDCRLTVEQVLGLQVGDAHIIRNAGGLVTEDALRSLIISHHKLGTQEVMIIAHTDCGMLAFHDEDLRAALARETGVETDLHFRTFDSLEDSVRQQIGIVRTHPWLPAELTVRGFIYDVRTGLLHEVHADTEDASGAVSSPDTPAGSLPALAPLAPLSTLERSEER